MSEQPSAAAAVRRGLPLSALWSPRALVAAGVVLAASTYALWRPDDNPPGFHHDEASTALNAYLLGVDGHDQDGRFLPLFFVSFGGYLNPIFTYLLAGVFKLTGPSENVARELGAVCVLLGIAALAALAWRLTRSVLVATIVFCLAVVTPWFRELGGVAVEMSLMPLAIVALLAAVGWAYRSSGSSVLRGIVVALALAFLTYVYAGGRGAAPLYAVALALFVRRASWRWVAVAWAAYGVLLVPLLLNMDAARGRYEQTRFYRDGMPVTTAVGTFLENYFRDLDPARWALSGDPAPYIHVPGPAQFFAAVIVLAAVGAAIVLIRRRDDLWWRWAICVLLLSPVPAALTTDRYNSYRLLPLAVLFFVLAVPALAALVRSAASARTYQVAAAVLLVSVGVQFADFLHWYGSRGPARRALFEADVPALLASGFASRQTIYVDFDDRHAQTMVWWFLVDRDLPPERMSVLPDGGMPPVASLVHGHVQDCDFQCTRVAEADEFWLARVDGPPLS